MADLPLAADIVIDPESRESPFEQVRSQLEARIRDGRLMPGDRLPTVRGLAVRLGLAANTVARAYKLLEAAGLVETHSRAGTTVASGAHAAEAALAALAARFVAECRQAGLGDTAALALVRDAQRAG
ncbi:MAG: GntR family transcriptional regulator [Dermatophilaceae bacterium]|nr:GntR family transcriptional regulator [Dermatophilaceae bacterium]NUO91564.1 GntR family transcriptional regulator [Dermatophilaceae bacterium]